MHAVSLRSQSFSTASRIIVLGGAIVMAPEDTPYGKLAVAQDPTGAQFSLAGR